MEEQVKFEHFYITVSGGIMQNVITSKEMDLDVAKTCVSQRITFSQGTSYPCLFDLTNVKNVSKDARDYLAKEGNELVKASALLITSSVTKMIGNFFIAVNKPVNPTRIFTNKDEAFKWLEQYK